MIFLDTNVISETFKKAPDQNVLAWLARRDGELALSTVAMPKSLSASPSYARRSAPDGWCEASPIGAGALPTVSFL